MSSGDDRIVVNCGAGGPAHQAWNAALRATAAHSTLTLADTSSARILPPGLARDLLGPRLMGGPVAPVSRRVETAQGWTVEAMHDGYVAAFGLRHERQVTLSPQGLMVTGRDRLVPDAGRAERARPAAFHAVRFHIHPDVRVSRLEGGGILLKLPGGEGWRFRAGGGHLEVEESVYLGGPTVRRAEQLVVSGITKDAPAEIAWVFEHIVDIVAGSPATRVATMSGIAANCRVVAPQRWLCSTANHAGLRSFSWSNSCCPRTAG